MKPKPRLLIDRLLLILLCLIGINNIISAEGKLFLKNKEGLQTSYDLKGVKKITFQTGKIEINKFDGSKDDFSFNNVQFLSFNGFTNININNGLQFENTLYLFPNPVSNILTIQYSIIQNTIAQIEIKNINGQVISQFYGNSFTGLDGLKLDVSKLLSGIYFCRLNNRGVVKTMKFIVTK